MRLLLLPHFGVGDHIMMNGLIHMLLQLLSVSELCLIVRDNYSFKTIQHMYSDTSIITFYKVSDEANDPIYTKLNRAPQASMITINDKEYVGFNFGLHSVYYILCYNLTKEVTWVDFLYQYPFRLDAVLRFTEFHCPSDMSRATEKYNLLQEKLGNKSYVIIHDDPEREKKLDSNIVKLILQNDNMLDLPIVYLGLNRYNYPLFDGLTNPNLGNLLACESLFDLLYILRGAAACHLVDSSIACLVDVSNIQTKLYCHCYGPHAGGAFTRQPWVKVIKE